MNSQKQPTIPPDVINEILNHLPPVEIAKVSHVSTQWKKISQAKEVVIEIPSLSGEGNFIMKEKLADLDTQVLIDADKLKKEIEQVKLSTSHFGLLAPSDPRENLALRGCKVVGIGLGVTFLLAIGLAFAREARLVKFHPEDASLAIMTFLCLGLFALLAKLCCEQSRITKAEENYDQTKALEQTRQDVIRKVVTSKKKK